MRISENNSSAKASSARKDGRTGLQAVAASPGRRANIRMASAWAPAKVAQGAAITSILVGLAALAGWWSNVATLQGIWLGRPIVPNTALMFALLGVALWLELPEPARSSWRVRF